jgi:hypothetical protein
MDKSELIYQDIERNYSIVTAANKYLRRYEEYADEKTQKTLRFERILLGLNVDGLLNYWDEESKNMMREYCVKRLQETNNNHLKLCYEWSLWLITEKRDFRLLNDAMGHILEVLETILNKVDYNHTSTFCDCIKMVLPCINLIGKKKIEKLIDLINRIVKSENDNLKYQIMALAFYQTREGNDFFLKYIGAQRLAEIGLGLALKEIEPLKKERQLAYAVFFAERTNNQDIKRESNEKMGDYKMNHLYPDDEKNLAIAHQNDHLLIEAMNCYKRAGNREKLKKTTLLYEKNKSKLRYPQIISKIEVEQRYKEIDEINKYIMDVVNGGTPAILDALFGNKIDVFISAEIIGDIAKVGGDELLLQTFMEAVNKDSFQNTRHTTHEKNMLHMLADYTYRNTTFNMFALIIYNGLNKGLMSYEILKDAMLQRGFAMELYKTNADGNMLGSTYFDRIDLGIKDFLRFLPESIDGKDVDWRYCISFLTTQFEGIFRDVLYKHGIPIDKPRRGGDTELVLLEGLLNDEQVKELFTDDDIFLFRQAFTKDGYNIRNEVAHGMYLPQEYTMMKALLVFLCVLRLSRGMR